MKQMPALGIAAASFFEKKDTAESPTLTFFFVPRV